MPCWIALLALLPGCASTGPVGEDQTAIDEWISAEVRRVLAEEEDVVVADLHIETHDGVVTLSGVQPTMEAVAKALNRTARVRGVLQVINQIRVVNGLGRDRAAAMLRAVRPGRDSR
jgi:osmotically-inducible protein OsmY